MKQKIEGGKTKIKQPMILYRIEHNWEDRGFMNLPEVDIVYARSKKEALKMLKKNKRGLKFNVLVKGGEDENRCVKKVKLKKGLVFSYSQSMNPYELSYYIEDETK